MRDIEPFIYRQFDDVISKSDDWAVNCPFCIDRVGKDDTKHHLQISKHKEACHCFRCDYSASWIQLVMAVTGKTYAFALGEIYVIPKPDLSQLDIGARSLSNHSNLTRERCSLPDGYKSLNPFNLGDSAELRTIKKYLRLRGFDPSYWKRYGLGYVPGQWRVYIPIEDDFWQARAVLPYMSPKYMSPKVSALHYIFNSSALELYDEVVVCEGAFSAMAIGNNAIALIGKNPVREKIDRLKRSNVRKFILAVEYNAGKQMSELARMLSDREIEIWKYDKDTDPADWVSPRVVSYDFAAQVSMLLQP